MKLIEFLKLNDQIGELHLDIRDYSNGGAALVEQYKIGSHALEDRVRNGNKPRWVTVPKTINKIENVYKTGNAFWGIITEPIPKRLLDMEVTNFRIMGPAFAINNGCWKLERVGVWLRGSDADALALLREREALEESGVDENGQLKGQMSFL